MTKKYLTPESFCYKHAKFTSKGELTFTKKIKEKFAILYCNLEPSLMDSFKAELSGTMQRCYQRRPINWNLEPILLYTDKPKIVDLLS